MKKNKVVHHLLSHAVWTPPRWVSRRAPCTKDNGGDIDQSGTNSQLQQSQVGVAVKCAVLALLSDIVLEYCGGLGVVSVQAVEDGVDMRRPCVALVESNAHFVERIGFKVGRGRG